MRQRRTTSIRFSAVLAINMATLGCSLFERVDDPNDVPFDASDDSASDADARDSIVVDSANDGLDSTVVDTMLDAGEGESDAVSASTWKKMADSPLAARYAHVAVWTGTSMIVWGGYHTGGTYFDDGAVYTPSTNTWVTLPASPLSSRRGHSAVWSGTAMIVWGGEHMGTPVNDGASYDPSTNKWTALSTSSLFARTSALAVWSTTTNEMLIWGGNNNASSTFPNGAAYKPATDSWRGFPGTVPIAGRNSACAVWTGSEMVIWGGITDSSAGCPAGCPNDGASFNPFSGVWTSLPSTSLAPRYESSCAVSGSELFVFGGLSTTSTTSSYFDDGAHLPIPGSWTAIPSIGSVSPYGLRASPQIWFGGGRLWVWGGLGNYVGTTSAAADGVFFDPGSGSWKLMPAAPIAGRFFATAVWTGTSAMVWGGRTSLTADANDGAIHTP